ncbi:MAG: hypothetical protein DRI61_07340, partial [Chloroflexi bacterium]
EEMATVLKEKMRQGEFKIPYLPVRKLTDIDLISELNVEKFELAKSGHIMFSHPEGCYSEDTRVFTKKGLKYVHELHENDLILTLNPETHRIEFQKPLNIFKYRYSGKMYHFQTRFIDLLVTPNHNMYVKYKDRHKGRTWKTGFKFMKAEDVANFHLRNVVVKTKGEWKGRSKAFFKLPKIEKSTHKRRQVEHIPIDLWLKFLGFWLAEGSAPLEDRKAKRVCIRNKDSEKLREIKNVLEQMGFNPHVDYKIGQITIWSKQLHEYLKQFGHAKDKFIPNEVKNLPSEKLRLFLTYLIKGDGSFRDGKPRLFFTSSEKLANDVLEVALKAGYSAKISKRISGFMKSTGYVIRLREHGNGEHSLCRVKEEYYDGLVWCVEVPNHIILVERNGKLCFCGNSHDDVFWAVALAVYAAVKYAPITVARGKRILWAFGKALKNVWGWSRKRL